MMRRPLLVSIAAILFAATAVFPLGAQSRAGAKSTGSVPTVDHGYAIDKYGDAPDGFYVARYDERGRTPAQTPAAGAPERRFRPPMSAQRARSHTLAPARPAMTRAPLPRGLNHQAWS